MELSIHIFEINNAWAYQVGGVYQEFHPDKEGFVPMTYEEACAKAFEIYQRIK